MIDRRRFLLALPGAVAVGALLRPRPASAICTHSHPHDVGMGRRSHPEPRPGITGSEVIPAAVLRAEGMPEEVIALWDGIREIPKIADGIACYCGCMLPPMNRRSLLDCYHADGMARGCVICQGTARLVIGRAAEGQTLDRIRAAVDARYAL